MTKLGSIKILRILSLLFLACLTIGLHVIVCVCLSINFLVNLFIILMLVFRILCIIVCYVYFKTYFTVQTTRYPSGFTGKVSGFIGLNLMFCGACVLFSIIAYNSDISLVTEYTITIQTSQFILLMVVMCFFDQMLEKLVASDYSLLVQSGEDNETLGECPICIEEGELVTLNCNHTFHEHCIKKWLVVNSTCPMCRTQV